MNQFNPQSKAAPRVLATDLDGTLIPLPESTQNRADLEPIREHFSRTDDQLVFATGRHFESVVDAMSMYNLPTPEWIVCDVGSAIYQRVGSQFEIFSKYETHLAETSGGLERTQIEAALAGIEGLALQPPDHQQRFKISYQSTAQVVDRLVDAVNARLVEEGLPHHCMGSHDPFMDCGLLDVMPEGVSKAYALLWLSTHANFHPDEVIYAGDSGNDYAALVSGFRAIVVANRSSGLAEKVTATLQSKNLESRLFLAGHKATSGVLQGCRHFGLI